MWQKCPICEGTGFYSLPLSATTTEKCSVCDGKKIISELTGLPPNNTEQKTEQKKFIPGPKSRLL